jgi:uncharacterized protein (DUF2236 family)
MPRTASSGPVPPQLAGPARAPADFDIRDVIDGAALLASTANVIMQLARPAGMIDVHTLLHGPADDAVADAIYRECRRLGTTLQVPEQMWPVDRAAFERYWNAALAEVRIDPPVRSYLDRLMALDYLPRPLRTAIGPVSRFLTAGFLPPPFRAQMQLSWTERDKQIFAVLIALVSVTSRFLPGPVSRFPFNACLADLRIRRLMRIGQ